MTKLFSALSATLVLAGIAGAANAQSTEGPSRTAQRPAPEALGPVTARYILPNARSVKSAQSNVATVVRIQNTSKTTCNYMVRFFFTNGTNTICDAILTDIPPDLSRAYCSRILPDANNANVSACTVTCDPELTSHSARAVVFSSKKAGCEQMAVDALQIWTNTDDTAVQGAFRPTIVKIDPAEVAKSNKGD